MIWFTSLPDHGVSATVPFDQRRVHRLLGADDFTHKLDVVHIRYKNKQEIRRSEHMTVGEFKRKILESMESGWGFDMDVFLPASGQTLAGHHDGVYWLKPSA